MRTGNTVLTGCVVLIIGSAGFAPRTSYAGDEEWATAGKVLAGVAAFHVVGSLLSNHHDSYTKRKVYHRHRRYHRRYKQQHERRRTTTYCDDYKYVEKNEYRRYRRRPCRKVIVEREVVRPAASYGCDVVDRYDEPIIIYLDDCQRICQPRIHGRTDVLEIWGDYKSVDYE